VQASLSCLRAKRRPCLEYVYNIVDFRKALGHTSCHRGIGAQRPERGGYAIWRVGTEECSRRGLNQKMDPTEQENAINRNRRSLLYPDASPCSAWFLTAIHSKLE
jgi:hypothetical protein